MWKLVLLVLVLFGSACDKFKGDKGDSGTNGSPALISSKTYTGTPTNNPFRVTVSELTDLSKQTIDVYSVSGPDNIRLPITGTTVIHLYSVSPSSKYVEFMTAWTSGGTPTKALSFQDGTQYGYRIDVKTFSASPSKPKLNPLIYGRD